MSRLTEEQAKVLKDLWDRTIRPESRIAARTGLSPEQVKECLKELKSKGLVLEREKPNTWRITPDGETRLRPWYERPLGIVFLGLIVAIIGGVISAIIVLSLGKG